MRQLVAALFLITFLSFHLVSNDQPTNQTINGRTVMNVRLFGSTMSKTKFITCQSALIILGLYFLVTGEKEYWKFKITDADKE